MKIQRTIICTFLWSISFLDIIAQNDKYFVDMGVRADNGDVLLWANGDLASLKDGSFVILEQDQIGDTYGWGDITGKAVGTNLSQYGGVNPSVEISGNPSFDITTSKLGSEYRLPTYKEIERLVKNSRISTFKARRNLPAIDSYGVPTWIYGQWMWQGGGNWHSIKFDGPIANIISSDKGRITTTYEGVYKYKDGILYIGNLKLSADKERNVLSADNGGFFIKVSSQSDEAEIEYYVIESKINHNKLYFPLYRKTQHLSSNNGYMAVFDTPNRDRIGYWSGSLLTVEGKQGGIYLLMDSRYFQPQIDNRYEHYRIRPVKSVNYSKVGNPCHTSNGYSIIWVEKDGKLGIYNDDGKELQPCDIDKAYILTEYNSIELSYTDCPSTDYIYIVRNGLTGLISGSTFETIIPCMYEYLSPIKTSKAFYKANGKWGIIDTSNKTIQLAIYDNVEIDGSTLSEQKMPSMAFQSNMYVRNNGKVGMLKANGEDFIPVKYDSLGMYSDNMLVAKVGDKYGFLNEEGKESVPFAYSQAHNYSEGLAAVVNENGKYLFIDKLGNVAIKPKEYDRVDDFQNGTCKVYRKDKVWEIDREGKKVKDSTKKLEADDTHVGCGNDDMYVENTNYPNDIDTNNTLTPNITPTLSFNDKFFQHQQIKTDNVIPNNKNKDETELKYEISDLKRQKLNGRIKKIGCDSYNEKEDPNGMGHGEESYEFEYDNNGMLTKYSYEAPYVGDITFHYNNGKLISSSGYLGGSSFLYQKKDKTTVNIIERDKDGEERIVMTLNFYPNGVIKQKRILSSLVDPYNKETVIRYDTNGIEIDDMPSYGEIISEERDSHNNWTKRIFRDGREVTRDIEYY